MILTTIYFFHFLGKNPSFQSLISGSLHIPDTYLSDVLYSTVGTMAAY